MKGKKKGGVPRLDMGKVHRIQMEGGKPKAFTVLSPKRPEGDSGAESLFNSSNYSSPMDEFGVSVATKEQEPELQ